MLWAPPCFVWLFNSALALTRAILHRSRQCCHNKDPSLCCLRPLLLSPFNAGLLPLISSGPHIVSPTCRHFRVLLFLFELSANCCELLLDRYRYCYRSYTLHVEKTSQPCPSKPPPIFIYIYFIQTSSLRCWWNDVDPNIPPFYLFDTGGQSTKVFFSLLKSRSW